MKRLDKNEGIKIFNINWNATTAGPSPFNNERVEVFCLGCKKAASGNPCPGCFNSSTWEDNAEYSLDPVEVADMINEKSDNKYVTIGGGEPSDQEDAVYLLCKRLKELGKHIILYSWRDMKFLLNSKLLDVIDVAILGEYKQEERCYKEDAEDGLFNSVGSGNQKIIDVKCYREKGYFQNYKMDNIYSITLDENDFVKYELSK